MRSDGCEEDVTQYEEESDEDRLESESDRIKAVAVHLDGD